MAHKNRSSFSGMSHSVIFDRVGGFGLQLMSTWPKSNHGRATATSEWRIEVMAGVEPLFAFSNPLMRSAISPHRNAATGSR
jgi:hypothetical protein